MEVTLCFVDLAGFSALTEAHGDHAAADLALAFGAMVEEALAGDARIVDTIGDAVFVVAEQPTPAIHFIARLWDRAEREPAFPALRAGLHHGETVSRGSRIFGAAVNIAARVAAQAGGGQVLATAHVGAVARAEGLDVTSVGPVTLRNIVEPIELFAIAVGTVTTPETIDPVCRMRVERERAAARVQVSGTEYFFCSLDCTARFTARPEAYVAPRGAAKAD